MCTRRVRAISPVMVQHPAISLSATVRATLPIWMMYSMLVAGIISLAQEWFPAGFGLFTTTTLALLIVPLSVATTHWSFYPYMRNFYEKYRGSSDRINPGLQPWYDWHRIRRIFASVFWRWRHNLKKLLKLPFVHHLMGGAIGFRDQQFGSQTTGHNGVVCLFDARKVFALQLALGGFSFLFGLLTISAIQAATS